MDVLLSRQRDREIMRNSELMGRRIEQPIADFPVLFGAGLRYDRMSDTLSSQEVRRLYRAIQETLQDAIKARGTTLDDEAYVDLFGKPGEYQHELKVYGRTGLPCRRCRTPIQTVKISGRGAYHCPQCQS